MVKMLSININSLYLTKNYLYFRHIKFYPITKGCTFATAKQK